MLQNPRILRYNSIMKKHFGGCACGKVRYHTIGQTPNITIISNYTMLF